MTTDDLAKSLLLRILSDHRGHDNRIERAALKQELGERMGAAIGDRKLRSLIEELRFDDPRGAWLCGSLSGGYFFAKDEAELDQYLAADEHRALTLLARIRNQRRSAGQQDPAQMRMLVN